MGFSRQEYWSGSPFPLLGGPPDAGNEPASPAFPGGFLTTESPGSSHSQGLASKVDCSQRLNSNPQVVQAPPSAPAPACQRTPHWDLQETLSSETFLLPHDFRCPCARLQAPFTPAQGNSSVSQVSRSRSLHSPVTELLTAHFRAADCEGRKNLRDALETKPPFFHTGNLSPETWGEEKMSGWQSWGTANSLLVVCSCHGIKTRVPRARGCPAVPQAPGDGRRLRGDPKNSCIFSASYIKVKHKISFERKGFTVNKQTSWKPLHGRANFK